MSTTQQEFNSLLTGKIDATTLAEFRRLQIHPDSCLNLNKKKADALRKIYLLSTKHGTISDLEALAKVSYNILGEEANQAHFASVKMQPAVAKLVQRALDLDNVNSRTVDYLLEMTEHVSFFFF